MADVEHSRWDEEHYNVCEQCRADRYDALLEMEMDAHLDAMSDEWEENNLMEEE